LRALRHLLYLQPIETHLPDGASPAEPGNYPTTPTTYQRPSVSPPRAKLPLHHSNNSAILEVQYHEVIRLLQFILAEISGKMQDSSSSALSALINNSPLQPRTSVRLLRFRKLASGVLNLEGCQNFGDEIVDFIEGKELPSNGNEDGVDASAEAIADLPYIELLWAL
jgi:hypothetical protein